MTTNPESQNQGDAVAEEPVTDAEVQAAVQRSVNHDATPAAAAAADARVEPESFTANSDATAQGAPQPEYAAETTPLDPKPEPLSAADSVVVTETEDAGTHTVAEIDPEPYPSAFGNGAETRPFTPAEAAAAVQPPTTPTEDAVANFFVAAPTPPEIRGNRLAGVLITLLATIVFAALYCGVYVLFEYSGTATQRELVDSVVGSLVSPGYYIAVIAFFIAMSLLVLIFGRAGWWAYVLGGFFVAIAVWAGALLGFALAPQSEYAMLQASDLFTFDKDALRSFLGSTGFLIMLAAGVIAREVTVWFGAWIGARGRRVKEQNRAAVAEYEAAVAGVDAAKQSPATVQQ